jgi:TolB-like protein
MSRLATHAAYAVRGLLAAASLALVASPAAAQSDARPNVAVLAFENGSFGKARAEFEGLGKGIGDLLLNDLATAGRFRVVERERLQALLQERDLVTTGAVDPANAVKLGKLLGVHYMITGTFIADPKSRLVLTARAIDVETGAITNPQKVQSKGDDALALVAELSERLQRDLKLPAKALGETRPGNDAGAIQTGGKQAADAARGADQGAKAAAGGASSGDKVTSSAKKSSPQKMDVRTTLLYAKALDEQDRGNAQRATELYRAVLARVPDYAPAKSKLARLEKARG